MRRKSETAFFLAIILLVSIFILPSIPNASAAPTTYSISAKAARIQEGLATTLNLSLSGLLANTSYDFTINVTDPGGLLNYTAAVTVKTGSTGVGWNTTIYPTDFTTGANTNYTGTYSILVNQISPVPEIGVAKGNFTVGLTDKLEYHATEAVNIRGSGYQASENVTVGIKVGGASVSGYPKNITANINGILSNSWSIPINAVNGTYTVTLTTVLGIVKIPPDTQNFTVIVVQIIGVLKPSAGPVGTTVRITGEIIQPNGKYEILWDGENMKNGTCAPGSITVNDTFIVPPSVKGNHTVTLRDYFYGINSTSVIFLVNETTYYVFAKPNWVQEGLDANITAGLYGGKANANYAFTIKVTSPKMASFNASVSFKTDIEGSGNGTKSYLNGFNHANTSFVGTYIMEVNETLAKGEFTVALTDKPTYKLGENVSIRASAYKPSESVTINIKFSGLSVAGYPKNVTANTQGVVTNSWIIPMMAELGNYTVTITNTTISGTVKKPADVQNFTVIGITCQIQIRNLDNETVAGVIVYAWNSTKPTTLEEVPVAASETNETGWVSFPLEVGNYTFWALWNEEVVVGSLTNQSVTGNTVLNMTCRLAEIGITVREALAPPHPLPFINVTLMYNYTTWYNASRVEAPSFETGLNGTVVIGNTLTNISYLIQARRYDHLFNQTLIKNLTASLWINITCPTDALFVNVLDANGLPVKNVQVGVYEWTTWIPMGPAEFTNGSGSADFFVTFGRYEVSVFNYTAELKSDVVINETIIDLVNETQPMVVYCKLLNLDVTVKVVDYFGRPVPNALIDVKRENESNLVLMEMGNLTTGSSGIIPLNSIIGGEYQFSVYIRGKLCEVTFQLLDSSRELVLKIGGYVVIGGYPMDTGQFVTLISVILVCALCLAILFRELPSRMKRKKTPSKKAS
jgi:hypothetical protein